MASGSEAQSPVLLCRAASALQRLCVPDWSCTRSCRSASRRAWRAWTQIWRRPWRRCGPRASRWSSRLWRWWPTVPPMTLHRSPPSGRAARPTMAARAARQRRRHGQRLRKWWLLGRGRCLAGSCCGSSRRSTPRRPRKLLESVFTEKGEAGLALWSGTSTHAWAPRAAATAGAAERSMSAPCLCSRRSRATRRAAARSRSSARSCSTDCPRVLQPPSRSRSSPSGGCCEAIWMRPTSTGRLENERRCGASGRRVESHSRHAHVPPNTCIAGLTPERCSAWCEGWLLLEGVLVRRPRR
mmetsp:Transcript_16367/g.57202  ORF Transcript_16367/g.57202 Transcript_16367/m.57202 type:complete len:298 (+) Transcript_16367:212-1105(+)